MSETLINQGNHHRSVTSSDDVLLQEFETHLKARGHRDGTLHAYLVSAKHFLRWIGEQPSSQGKIVAQTVRNFLHVHLPVCDCSQPVTRNLKTVRASLNQLLLMLGYDRLRPPGARTTDNIETSITQFDRYMHEVCGLAENTRWSRCRFVRGFLKSQFDTQPLRFELITPETLIQYVTEQAHHYRPGTVGVLACALRGYLRFLQFSGNVPSHLGEAIPRPPNWSLAALPVYLSENDFERFWKAFDRTTAIGKRDYAMARCLADLALRCQEVADMHLDTIDWRAGILHLPRTKSQRADLMPLPEATGQALVDYLSRGRPSCASQAVFVHHRAPLGKAVAITTVRGAIRRAFSRAGLPWNGTHVIRRTAATRLLQTGSSIKMIADVLRHGSIDTTMIYTKVDLPNLSRVAMPWPERRS